MEPLSTGNIYPDRKTLLEDLVPGRATMVKAQGTRQYLPTVQLNRQRKPSPANPDIMVWRTIWGGQDGYPFLCTLLAQSMGDICSSTGLSTEKSAF